MRCNETTDASLNDALFSTNSKMSISLTGQLDISFLIFCHKYVQQLTIFYNDFTYVFDKGTRFLPYNVYSCKKNYKKSFFFVLVLTTSSFRVDDVHRLFQCSDFISVRSIVTYEADT
jgi:hypothetical protein